MHARNREGDQASQARRPKQTESSRPAATTSEEAMLALQRSIGNAAVARLITAQPHSCADGCSHAQPVQRSTVPDVLRSAGRPLDAPLRAEMEDRMGVDFSDVRLHTGPAAQRSATEIGARAYTSGSHIVAGTGGLDKHTLAHELTHVIQQRSGQVAGTDQGDGLRISDPGDRFEREAEANATRVLAGSPRHDETPRQATEPATGSVQRAVDEEQAVRPKVLVVSDVSGNGLGGVPVFNMELIKGLTVNHDVTMLTADEAVNHDTERKSAEHGGAQVVNDQPPVRADDPTKRVEGRLHLVSMARQRPGDYGLPSKPDSFDVIIGHSRFSGPGAKAIRDAWYPQARLVHFLHTSPVRLDKIKERPDKGKHNADIERGVMQHSDLVVGVGPLLTAEAERLSKQILRSPAVHELVPGTDPKAIREHTEPAPPHQPGLRLPRPVVRLLLTGRATDVIKGVDAAVQAVGILRRLGLRIHLTIRGGPDPNTDAAKHQEFQNRVKLLGRGMVTVKPFTPNAAELDADRANADALIMPSLHEGFGLVATEAAGIPVMVNDESGAAEFLSRFEEFGQPNPMVVPAPYEIDPASGRETEDGTKDRAYAWASAIKRLSNTLADRREDAGQLQRLLSRYTWQHAADALIAAAMAATPGATRPGTGVSPNRGPITRQGPDGTVIEEQAHRADWTPDEYWDGTTTRPLPDRQTDEERAARLRNLRYKGILWEHP
ncbi:eCIS core domain-containing protein [Kutzneria sp. CA-103260]|uniref:eCIS core domain-containing protein n=1 Tax=Kutzneria sp. CA-103260 TaxID=2802641 RepID=UPI001BA65BAE|nr:DUF4157 domain-containing protein [Kutzneria sp. CA-103260]QUQ64302.1 D-inositol-3-phosphate glycosyltransferase [Kutzneria sp. CA-103260]